MSETAGRAIDHVVMPVEGLAPARAMLETLGFTVAPDASHPFGTGNACVFLADDTYIEPLAVLDRDLAENEAAKGNAFLRRDLAYRLRHPLPGLSGAALKSGDALADRAAFVRAGYDGGDILEFERRFDNPHGEAASLGFRLAFAGDRALPETFFFACQRLFDFAPDRAALTRHRNGASGLARLVYAAAQPEKCRPFISAAFGVKPAIANSFGFSVVAGGTTIDVLAPDGLAARYGVAEQASTELRLAGIVLKSNKPSERPDIGETGDFAVTERLGRRIVRLPQPSGMFLAFETSAGTD